MLGIGDGRGLPLTIILVIPILRLGGLRVRNELGLRIPVLGLLRLGVGDLPSKKNENENAFSGSETYYILP